MDVLLAIIVILAALVIIVILGIELFNCEITTRMLLALKAVKNTNPVNWEEVREETFINPVGNQKREISRAAIPYEERKIAIKISQDMEKTVSIVIYEGWREKASYGTSFQMRQVKSPVSLWQNYIAMRIRKEVQKKAKSLLDAKAL